MTMPGASKLVIQAGVVEDGGEVFALDMGDPVKILDMAKWLIHMSGPEVTYQANPEGDMEIVFTGLRPGEKWIRSSASIQSVKLPNWCG